VLLDSGLDALPGVAALGVSHALRLPEAGDGIARMRCVMDGFFPLLWEGKVFVGDLIAAGFIAPVR
jgi:hypothetical protein